MPRWPIAIRRPDPSASLALALAAAAVLLASLAVGAHPLNVGLADIAVGEREVALFFFNLGVEVGQVAVITLLLPLLRLLAHTSAYPATVTSASLGILGVATVWLVQRLL